MNYGQLLSRALRLAGHPTLWLLALLMALDAAWQFLLSTAFLYSGIIGVLREIAGEQLPLWLTSATVLSACLGVGVLCLLISTWGEAVLLSSIVGHDRLSQNIRSGWPRYGALLIVRCIVALPGLIVGGIAAGSFVIGFRTLLQRGITLEQFGLGTLGLSTLLSLIGTVVVIVTQCVAVGAERAAVLERLNAGAALKLGWHLLWRQLRDFVVIGVVLLLLSMALSAGLSCVGSVLLGGWLDATMRDGQLQALNPITWLSAGLIVWLIIALGYLFTTGVWTFAYQQWRSVPPPVKN